MNEEEAKQQRKELYTEQARSERFKRVAARRTDRILDDIRRLGNTSNKTLYKYSEGDVEKIFTAIDTRLTEVRAKFKTSKDKKPFTLD